MNLSEGFTVQGLGPSLGGPVPDVHNVALRHMSVLLVVHGEKEPEQTY